jgi:hypothetical protein
MCDIKVGNFLSILFYLLRNQVYFLISCLLDFAALLLFDVVCGRIRCKVVLCKFFSSSLLSFVLDLVNIPVCFFQCGCCC